MKSNKIWYLGCAIGICSLILMFALELDEVVEIVLTFVFGICVSVSHVQIMHHKMMEKDHNYKISVNDERNEKIRGGDTTSSRDITIAVTVFGAAEGEPVRRVTRQMPRGASSAAAAWPCAR